MFQRRRRDRIVCALAALALPRPSRCILSASSMDLSPAAKFFLSGRLAKIRTEVGRSLSTSSRTAAGGGGRFTIIFPGAGGPDVLTKELRSAVLAQDPDGGPVEEIDWTRHRGSPITAGFDSGAVGEGCADWLLSGGVGPDAVHGIGISVGAFAADAFVRRCAEELPAGTHVHLTLLDPFCGLGIADPGYGERRFGGGRGVSYAEQYLNTDDPVPFTNDALGRCVVYDVTGAEERGGFVPPEGDTMHSWPLAYYSRYGYSNMRERCGIAPVYGIGGAPERGVVIRV